MNEPKIARDGPGRLSFGDTLTVKGVTAGRHKEDAKVSFDAFGAHTEVTIRQNSGGGRQTAIEYTDRTWGDEQKEYIEAMAMLVAGLSFGWF